MICSPKRKTTNMMAGRRSLGRLILTHFKQKELASVVKRTLSLRIPINSSNLFDFCPFFAGNRIRKDRSSCSFDGAFLNRVNDMIDSACFFDVVIHRSSTTKTSSVLVNSRTTKFSCNGVCMLHFNPSSLSACETSVFSS